MVEERPAGALLPAGAPLAFHLLAKPTGAICNLDCTYCFFLSKEMLYPGSRFRMADDLLEAYIRQLLESQSSPDVIVGWQGGEPTLMGLDFFERSIAYVRQYKKPQQQVSYTLQTNGTRLDDAWCACTRPRETRNRLDIRLRKQLMSPQTKNTPTSRENTSRSCRKNHKG